MGFEFHEEEVTRTVSPELADELQFAPLCNLKAHASSRQALELVEHLASEVPPRSYHPNGGLRTGEQTGRASVRLISTER